MQIKSRPALPWKHAVSIKASARAVSRQPMSPIKATNEPRR